MAERAGRWCSTSSGKTEPKSCSTETWKATTTPKAAFGVEQRMGMTMLERCCRGGKRRTGGEEERKAKRLMGRCDLRGSHSHLRGGVSAGLRQPLSCVWSRSLAGGRAGGG